MKRFYCYYQLGHKESITIGWVVKAKSPKSAESKFLKKYNSLTRKNNIIIQCFNFDLNIEII